MLLCCDGRISEFKLILSLIMNSEGQLCSSHPQMFLWCSVVVFKRVLKSFNWFNLALCCRIGNISNYVVTKWIQSSLKLRTFRMKISACFCFLNLLSCLERLFHHIFAYERLISDVFSDQDQLHLLVLSHHFLSRCVPLIHFGSPCTKRGRTCGFGSDERVWFPTKGQIWYLWGLEHWMCLRSSGAVKMSVVTCLKPNYCMYSANRRASSLLIKCKQHNVLLEAHKHDKLLTWTLRTGATLSTHTAA